MEVRLRIQEVARQRGITQKQLAKKSGVTEPLLNRYWNNHTQSVTLKQLAMIASALGVKPGDLLEVVDETSAA